MFPSPPKEEGNPVAAWPRVQVLSAPKSKSVGRDTKR